MAPFTQDLYNIQVLSCSLQILSKIGDQINGRDKDLDFERRNIEAKGIRISVTDNGVEVGRAYIYLMCNDLHDQPFGLMEDVYVDESCRGNGIGSELVKQVIELAKEANCYKLIATSRISRPHVHDLYQRLGFTQHGVEFRIDLCERTL
ncbi:GNAT family N-acetyltransferase [Acaryochloris marina]|uniref:GNAT family N-acetyltransferase n=1 Tax=Acaryochloris marina TaxID=155978 RepID=UPI002017C5EA|nr:GNAT family N-acetyltransferase [Acaryochloris marina]